MEVESLAKMFPRNYKSSFSQADSCLNKIMDRTSGFGSGIAICPTKDAAIFIGMNQVGAPPISKGVEILRRLP